MRCRTHQGGDVICYHQQLYSLVEATLVPVRAGKGETQLQMDRSMGGRFCHHGETLTTKSRRNSKFLSFYDFITLWRATSLQTSK